MWVVAIVAINPGGDFPLNDDWAYADTLQRLLDTGQFVPSDWTSTTLLAHVLWGALFSWLFNDVSFTTLRISTQIAGAIGLGIFGMLLNALGCERRTALVACFALAFNPLFFVLANTFMTDVGFLTLTLGSSYLFIRYLQRERTSYLLAALGVAMVAMFARQLALFLPMAMFATVLLDRRRRRNALWLTAGGALACAAIYAGIELWFAAAKIMPETFNEQSSRLLLRIQHPVANLLPVLRNVLVALLYFGWFAFPALVLRIPRYYASMRAPLRNYAAAGILSALAVGLSVMSERHALMPLAGNVIQRSGIGPQMLADTLVQGLPALPPLPQPFWLLVTATGLLGAVLIAFETVLVRARIVRRARAAQPCSTETLARAYLLAGIAIYMVPLVLAGYYDRYLLPATALLLLLIAAQTSASASAPREANVAQRALRRLRVCASAGALALTAWLAVGGAHDYLGWNRARAGLADTLAQANVPWRKIDAGFETNGQHLYDRGFQPMPGKNWWWVYDDEYMITFSARPGYAVTDSREIDLWLPPFRTRVLTLQRIARQEAR